VQQQLSKEHWQQQSSQLLRHRWLQQQRTGRATVAAVSGILLQPQQQQQRRHISSSHPGTGKAGHLILALLQQRLDALQEANEQHQKYRVAGT
jgi:hypothetical protein